jgi:hypothetical protein
MSPTDRRKPTGAEPDPDDPPSAEEIRAAEGLRRALENEPATGDDARALRELARAVRAAASPESLSPTRHRQLLDRALAVAAPKAEENVVAMRRRKSKIAYLTWGATASALAVAAAVAVVIRGSAPEASMVSRSTDEGDGSALALSRSTAELFPEGIPRSGKTTDRVDRIASARARDFRQNRFARWGTP